MERYRWMVKFIVMVIKRERERERERETDRIFN